MTFTANILSQNDPRWKNLKLGFHATETIGEQGCALTCLAMMATGYGYPEKPDQLNKKLIALGSGSGYISSLMVWAGMTRIYPAIGIKDVYICSDVKPVPFKRIDSLLDYGQTVLIEIDSSMVTGVQSHWVLLTRKKSDDYVMLDPLPYPQEERDLLLMERYGYGRPMDQVITSVVFYECWQRGDGQSVLPALPGMFVRVVASTTSGLRLRVQPNTSASIIIKENALTPLHVLEDEAEARAKVGVTDQWIKVRDPQGFEGYAAAWYLEECQLPIPEEELIPESPEIDTPEISPKEPPRSEESGPLLDFEKKPAPIFGLPRKQHVLPKKAEPAPISQQTSAIIYVSSDVEGRGLRMRKTPSLTAGTVAVLDARQKLEILEDADIAKSKVGVVNEWIHVQTESGETGYCAAWLLVLPVSQAVNEQSAVGAMEVDPLADTKPSVIARVVTNNKQDEIASTKMSEKTEETELRVLVSKSVGNVGLRLRAAPETGSVIKVVTAGSELIILESVDTAQAKIGVEGKWLYVKDEQGMAGYTAAWYLEAIQQPKENIISGDSALMVNVSPAVGSGGLRLRAAPSLKSNIVKELPPLTQLVVLEPSEAARPKIGVMDQWLNVSTSDGAAGYVAAWYVVN